MTTSVAYALPDWEFPRASDARPHNGHRVLSSPTVSRSDEALLTAYRNGDADAFPTLYGRHRGPLLRYIRRISPRTDLVDEIAQETWLAIIEHVAPVPARSGFVKLLYTIARRRSLDRWRKLGRMPETDSLDGTGLEAAAPERETPEMLAANIDL